MNSFLCMIRSNGQFIPNLAAATANLRDITKNNAVFEWSDAHEAEFQNLKSAFTKDVLLRHYDTNSPTFIHVDAHYTGLSAILAQGPSIESSQAASRTTTKAEKNYSQLDLEATAMDFGLRQFRHILVGGPPVTVVTDHQPLVSLWNSQRKPSSRIERTLLRHQDINHTLIWRKGIANPTGYTRRYAIPIDQLPAHIAKEAQEHQTLLFLLHQPIYSTISQECLQEAQSKDQQLERLRHFIPLGQAPKNDPTLKSLHKVFTELSIGTDGILYRGNQILLPASLYDEAISLAHSGSHAGQDAIKRRIIAHFWFSNLDTIVRQRLETCHEYQIHTRSPFQTPLSSSLTPAHPWESLSLDLYDPKPTPYTVFDVKGAQYTLVPSDNSLSKQPIYRHASQIKLYCRQKPTRQSNSAVHSNSPFSNSTDHPKSIGFDFPDKRYTKQQLTNCANPAPIVEEPEHATPQATEQPSERTADAICHEGSEPDIIFCHPQQLLQDKPRKYGRAKKSTKNRR